MREKMHSTVSEGFIHIGRHQQWRIAYVGTSSLQDAGVSAHVGERKSKSDIQASLLEPLGRCSSHNGQSAVSDEPALVQRPSTQFLPIAQARKVAFEEAGRFPATGPRNRDISAV
jgi:hypothetical protein